MGDEAMLMVRGLRVRLPGTERDSIRGIDFDLQPGRCLGLAGESGAGTTTVLRALIGLLPSGSDTRGSVRLHGQELIGLSERAWRSVRGRQVAVVLRDPSLALDRTIRVGAQVAETLKLHKRVRRKEVGERVDALLREVGLPASTAGRYPRDLGAADGRRALLAVALGGDPGVLVVDDGPAALTLDEYAAFGSLVATITRARGLATLVMSHQVSTLAPFADEIGVLCGGLIMEQASPEALVAFPRLPYTSQLIRAVPELPEIPVTPDPRSRFGDRAAFGLIRLPPSTRPDPPPRPAVPEHLLVGCSYSLRCPRAVVACAEHVPGQVEDPPGHRWACWNPQSVPG